MPRFSVRIFSSPGGSALTRAGREAVPLKLSFSSVLPGGFKDCQFTLPRSAFYDWADLASGNHVEVWCGPFLCWAGRLATPTTDSNHQWQCQCLGYYFAHGMDIEFNTLTTGVRAPVDALVEIVSTCCPLLNVNLLNLDGNDTWSVDLSQNNYQGLYPKNLFDQISAFGDQTGLLWDVAVWDGQNVHYHARDRSRVTHSLPIDAGVFKQEGDGESVKNAVRIQYQAPQTISTSSSVVSVTTSSMPDASTTNTTLYYPSYSTYLRDETSISRYGLRTITLKENQINASQAAALAQVYLTLHAYEQPKYSLETSSISDAADAEFPLYAVRAGAVVAIPALANVGSLFIVETSYDAESNKLTLTPEFGFKRQQSQTRGGFFAKLATLNRIINSFYYDRSSGTSGTQQDANYASAIHTHSSVGSPNLSVAGTVTGTTLSGSSLSVSGNSTLTGVVAAGNNLNVAGTLNANGAGGMVAQNNIMAGNALFAGTTSSNPSGYGNESFFANGNSKVQGQLTVTTVLLGGTRVVAGSPVNPSGSDPLYVNGTSHFNGVIGALQGFSINGITLNQGGNGLSISSGLTVNGNFSVSGGTKGNTIHEADGTRTIFTALEMELTRYGCLIPLAAGEEAEDLTTLGPKLVSRLDPRFARNTDGHYAIVGLAPILDGTGAVVSHAAIVFSGAVGATQLPGPFGSHAIPASAALV